MADNNTQNNQSNGNKELMVFLTERFDKIDQKFVAIDQRFDKIDQKFIAIDQRFDGIDKQFTVFKNEYVADYKGLADLMMIQFEKIYEKLDQKADKSDMEKILATKADKSDIDRVLTRIALLGNKIDDYRAEEIGLKRQVEKHEKWHLQTATKIGLKLRPE
jgi:predicted lipoprotein